MSAAHEPTVATQACSTSIGKIDVTFHGGASWLYNLFSGFVAGMHLAKVWSLGPAALRKSSGAFIEYQCTIHPQALPLTCIRSYSYAYTRNRCTEEIHTGPNVWHHQECRGCGGTDWMTFFLSLFFSLFLSFFTRSFPSLFLVYHISCELMYIHLPIHTYITTQKHTLF